jgi:hypothetical protein
VHQLALIRGLRCKHGEAPATTKFRHSKVSGIAARLNTMDRLQLSKTGSIRAAYATTTCRQLLVELAESLVLSKGTLSDLVYRRVIGER